MVKKISYLVLSVVIVIIAVSCSGGEKYIPKQALNQLKEKPKYKIVDIGSYKYYPVIAESNNFVLVKLPTKEMLWTPILPEVKYPTIKTNKYGWCEISSNDIIMYKDANILSDIVTKIPEEAYVTILKYGKYFSKVRSPANDIGWIWNKYLKDFEDIDLTKLKPGPEIKINKLRYKEQGMIYEILTLASNKEKNILLFQTIDLTKVSKANKINLLIKNFGQKLVNKAGMSVINKIQKIHNTIGKNVYVASNYYITIEFIAAYQSNDYRGLIFIGVIEIRNSYDNLIFKEKKYMNSFIQYMRISSKGNMYFAYKNFDDELEEDNLENPYFYKSGGYFYNTKGKLFRVFYDEYKGDSYGVATTKDFKYVWYENDRNFYIFDLLKIKPISLIKFNKQNLIGSYKFLTNGILMIEYAKTKKSKREVRFYNKNGELFKVIKDYKYDEIFK